MGNNAQMKNTNKNKGKIDIWKQYYFRSVGKGLTIQ